MLNDITNMPLINSKFQHSSQSSTQERMKDFEVSITEVHLVPPATPTARHSLPLTTFDLMQKRDAMPYLQRLAFYEPPAQGIRPVLGDLQRSLGEVLVHFYPLAGRIRFPQGRRPEIDCNDSGVELSFAVADAFLEDMDLSQYSDAFKKLIQRGNYEETTMTGTAPLLAIQVTSFNCGGLTVAWSFDHVVADGIAMMHFLKSWAEVASGKPISILPIHDRDFEKRNPELLPEVDNVGSTAFKYRFVDAATNVVSRVFTFDESEVERMKQLVESDEHGPFTTYVAVAAHLWVVMTKSRRLVKSQKIGVQVAVNSRHKLQPSLPFEYFGNAVLPGVAASTVGELEAGGNLEAAIIIKERIRKFGMDDICSQFRAYNENYLKMNPMAQGLTDGIDIFFGSSLRHPLYEIDFGWGKPIAVRHGRFLWDGFCFLDPSPKGGKNIEITVHLPPHTMLAFSANVKMI